MQNKIRLNQTLIKTLKKDSICPRQIFETFIAGSVSTLPTESMMKGLVFEDWCLSKPGQATHEAPRLKNGNLSADYIRISEQAEKFKTEIMPQFGLEIKHQQLLIEHEYSDNVTLHGKLDFCSPVKDEVLGDIPMAIHDLKLTGSIFKTWGDFSWAFPYNIDHTQAFMYTYLYKEKFGWEIPFYYWVFDYSPDKNFKVFRKSVEAMHKLELQESIRMSVEKIEYFEKNGWDVEVANENNCKGCALKDNCKSFNPKKQIEII